MDRLDLWGMFMLGLLGTGHCIGMCGPLIFAFPGRTGKFMPHVWYHLGRVTTYTAVGGIMGGLGQMLAGAATGGAAGSLGGVALIKGVLWLVAAALLMLFGVTRLGVIREPGWLTALSPERIPGFKRALQGAKEHPRHGRVLFSRYHARVSALRPFVWGLCPGPRHRQTPPRAHCWSWRLQWAPCPGLSCSAPAPPPSSAATAGSPTSSPAW